MAKRDPSIVSLVVLLAAREQASARKREKYVNDLCLTVPRRRAALCKSSRTLYFVRRATYVSRKLVLFVRNFLDSAETKNLILLVLEMTLIMQRVKMNETSNVIKHV